MASSNKIHLNNSTRISLNDRFTIMQSVGVPAGAEPAPIVRRPRSRSRSRSRSVGRQMASPMSISPRTPPRVPRVQAILPSPRSPLAQEYEAALLRRHRMGAAIQSRGLRSAATTLSAKQRLAASMSRSPGGMRGVARRPLRRANLTTLRAAEHLATRAAAAGLSARGRRGILTPTAVLRQRRLSRAIKTLNQAAGVVGGRRAMGGAPTRLSRVELAQSQARARSASRSSLNRSASQTNLRRSNSRGSLNRLGGGAAQVQSQQQTRRPINRNFQQRARSQSRGRSQQRGPQVQQQQQQIQPRGRSRSRQWVNGVAPIKTPSIASRLGVRPNNANNNNKNNNGGPVRGRSQSRQRKNSTAGGVQAAVGGRRGALNRVNQGRISKAQRLGAAKNNGGQANGNNKKGGNVKNRLQRPAGGKNNLVGGANNGRPGRNKQRQGINNNRVQQKAPQRNGGANPPQGRGRRGKRGNRPAAGGAGRGVKKEDLDKELDKYMADTKSHGY